jgi:hypothetical protein
MTPAIAPSAELAIRPRIVVLILTSSVIKSCVPFLLPSGPPSGTRGDSWVDVKAEKVPDTFLTPFLRSSQFAFVNADAALLQMNGNIQRRTFSHFAAPFVAIQTANAFVNSDIKLERVFKGQEDIQDLCCRRDLVFGWTGPFVSAGSVGVFFWASLLSAIIGLLWRRVL